MRSQNTKFWKQVVEVGVKRCAQALLKMSIRWQDLDLSEEPLADVTGAGTREVKSIFVGTLMSELGDVSNNQLEKALREYRERCKRERLEARDRGEEALDVVDDDSRDDDDDDHQVLLATMVLEAMLSEVRADEAWWQLLRKGGKDRRIGHGGVNKFIAELRVVSQSAQASKLVEGECEAVIKKITEVYQQVRPEKKSVQAGSEWVQGYMALCTQQRKTEGGST